MHFRGFERSQISTFSEPPPEGSYLWRSLTRRFTGCSFELSFTITYITCIDQCQFEIPYSSQTLVLKSGLSGQGDYDQFLYYNNLNNLNPKHGVLTIHSSPREKNVSMFFRPCYTVQFFFATSTCNAILLLRDVKLPNTSIHYTPLMFSQHIENSSLITLINISQEQNCIASCKKNCTV